MYKQGVPGFKYFVGISSLAQVATREDRVCVLNILGGESSDVTPVSHAFSGGNVAFGTSPGRGGPKLIAGMGALQDTVEALGLPYRFFGFDSAISEVVNHAQAADRWMKAGGREQVAQRLGLRKAA